MKKQRSLFGLGELDGAIVEAVEKLLAEGIELDAISTKLEKLIPGATSEAGHCLMAGLKTAPEMLKDRRTIQNQFQARLYKRWKRGLDELRMLIEAAREAGEEFNQHFRPRAVRDGDLIFEALVRLHARACLVSSEVFYLMIGGYASGAMARWRTLHELSVVAYFIKEKGQQVAERYLLHHFIESYKAALQYQEHCKVLSRAPLSKKEIRKLTLSGDRLCKRFGKPYSTDWGWAADALQNPKPSFSQIEEAISLGHFRPYFGMACYSNHAGSKGIHFDLGNAFELAEKNVLLAGPSDGGLFDPGVCTAGSLLQVTTTLLLHGEPSVQTMAICQALKHLADELENAFAECERHWEEKATMVAKLRGQQSRQKPERKRIGGRKGGHG